MAWKHARAHATSSVNKFGDYAARKINNRVAAKHFGNNAETRAMANELKRHVAGHINIGKQLVKNKIRTAQAPKIYF